MLSIIIPVYCVENTLDRCLESIVNQSYADFEIILVDDGSPDRSPALCDAWAQRDPRIHVIHQENKGLSCARNAGIEKAQGDFLTFIDSDDYIEAETLAQVMAAMADNDIVEYPVDGFCGGPNPFLLTFQPKVYDDMEDYWLNGRAYEHAYAWNKIYRRTLFDHVRYPEGRVFEDIHTLPQLLQQARRIATTNQGLYHYCWNDKGITANPIDCQTYHRGDVIAFNYVFEDDTELGSFNIEIHNNFEHHTHSTSTTECEDEDEHEHHQPVKP